MRTTILTLMLVIFLSGCNTPSDKYITLKGGAEGTNFAITYLDPQGRDLTDQVMQLFEEFEASLSIYNPSSLVSRINDGDTTAHIDHWMRQCLELSEQISRASDGLFDITLAPLISAYGFGSEAGVRTLSQAEIDSMLRYVGFNKIKLENGELVKSDPRTQLDFNAIAKGYSVDLLGKMMDSLGVKNYLIEVGGEIFCRGERPKGGAWRVGVDSPFEGNFSPGQDIEQVFEISGVGLATSGNYRKFAYNEQGEKVVHTIDPRTGCPVSHNLLSATIIASSCALADGYATACMVAGLERSKEILAQHPEIDAYLIYATPDGQMVSYETEGMKKRILQQ